MCLVFEEVGCWGFYRVIGVFSGWGSEVCVGAVGREGSWCGWEIGYVE